MDRQRTWAFLKRHGWKLLLFPVFFDVPPGVKWGCAAVLAASIMWDVITWRRKESTVISS
ncbi:MAG: hypothetical protein QOE60_2428 [Thermoleophilaceae bacterium]|jgi:hypothetical protein|nr:hypothetical protein [Thermoleophilaceae bacterium]